MLTRLLLRLGEAFLGYVEPNVDFGDTDDIGLDEWRERALAAEGDLARVMGLLHTPAQDDFLEASVTEAKYQRTRWSDSDAEKTDSEWFWLVGYLVGKAFHDVRGKRVHHLTAAAAALANWHAAAIARGEHMPSERGDQRDHEGRLG